MLSLNISSFTYQFTWFEHMVLHLDLQLGESIYLLKSIFQFLAILELCILDNHHRHIPIQHKDHLIVAFHGEHNSYLVEPKCPCYHKLPFLVLLEAYILHDRLNRMLIPHMDRLFSGQDCLESLEVLQELSIFHFHTFQFCLL